MRVGELLWHLSAVHLVVLDVTFYLKLLNTSSAGACSLRTVPELFWSLNAHGLAYAGRGQNLQLVKIG